MSNGEIRILFVEDVPADMELAEIELLKEGIRFLSVRVDTKAEFLNQLDKFQPDIILTDYVMPSFDGMEVIALTLALKPYIPVIVVTGSINEETAVSCMKAGASDYLLKDKLLRLPFAVNEALVRKANKTSRYQAQAALLKSEERFKAISEVTGEFIWEVDQDGMYTYVNRMSVEALGYTSAEIVGKVHFYDFFLEEEKEEIKAAAFSVFDRKETFRAFRNKIRHKDGRILVLETTGTPILDNSGDILGYRGVDRDVTERVKAEELLKSKNEMLGKTVKQRNLELKHLSDLNDIIVNSVGLAVISTDAKGMIESFNPEAVRLIGYSKEDTVGLLCFRIRESGDEQTDSELQIELTDGTGALHSELKTLFETEMESGSISKEILVIGKNGNSIPVQLTLSVLDNEVGKLQGYVAVLSDITERKRITQALESSEKLFRTMFAEHGAVMLLVDPDTGIIEEANNSAAEFYGYDFDCTPRLSISVINTISREQLSDEMEKAVANKLNYFVFTHRLASGELRKVEVHSTPIIVKGQKLLFSIIHDVTERIKIQEQLEKSEAENKAIVSTVPDLLFRMNTEGLYLESYTNSNSSLYVPREVFIGKNILDILPAELATESLKKIKQAVETKRIISFDYKLEIAGVQRFFENRIVAINDQEVLSIIRDITDRKTMELSLEWNESLLRLMASSSPMAFFVVDNRTDEILYFNERFCEIWGISHLRERMARKELKNNDIIPDCLPVLKDIAAFAESCKPLQFADNRVTIEDYIPFIDGRIIRRFSTQIRGENDEYYGRFYIFEDITERKKAEEQVQLRESYLSAVINNHPGMFWLKDTNGKFVFINDRNNQFMMNANLSEVDVVIDKTDYEFMPADLAEKYGTEDRLVIETHTPFTIEEKFIVDGIEHWYEKFKYPVLDKDGNVIGVSGYSMDITDRKEAEFRLKMQNAAFDSFALAMIITDPDGIIEWVNPAFTKLTGYSIEESIGQKPSLLKSGVQNDDFYLNMWNELISGRVWSGEIINRRKDGSLYFEEETITPVMNDQGEITRFIAIKIDISHRKEMEEALRLSEQRWQFALEGSGDGVWDWNIITNEVYFSGQWKAMLGFGEHELRNELEEWSSRVHPEDLNRCNEDIDAHFKGMTPVYINEHRMLCKDGSYKWILDRGKVVEWNEQNNPARMIGTHTDITQSKELQKKLMDTIEKERELNEMKSRFVATASHEFRTPLASILIICDTLLEYWKRLEEKQISERLAKIKDQTLHLTTVVNNVLQLSRIQQGKLGFNPELYDIIQLCHQSVDSFQSDPISLERIRCKFEVPELKHNIDKGLFIQALTNLLSNALKYSPWNTEVLLHVQLKSNSINISVKDQGIGIPLEEQKHLFVPFFRASNTRLIQGNGLGLNIVRESIRMHGGEITFTSKPGKGSTFNIIIPLSGKM